MQYNTVHHQSRDLGGRGGDTKDDAVVSLLHPSRSSALCSSTESFILVYSLMLSIHDLFCLPLFLPPSSVPCSTVFGRVLWRVTWPNHVSFFFLTMVRRGSCGPASRVIWLLTNSLVFRSLQESPAVFYGILFQMTGFALLFQQSMSRFHFRTAG